MHDARSDYIYYGGDLISFANKQEQDDFISCIRVDGQKRYYWIGFNDLQNHDTWVWSDGRQKTSVRCTGLAKMLRSAFKKYCQRQNFRISS